MNEEKAGYKIIIGLIILIALLGLFSLFESNADTITTTPQYTTVSTDIGDLKEVYTYPPFGIYMYVTDKQPTLDTFYWIDIRTAYGEKNDKEIYIFNSMPNIQLFEDAPKNVPAHLMFAAERQRPVFWGMKTQGSTYTGQYIQKLACIYNGSYYDSYKNDNFTNFEWVNTNNNETDNVCKTYSNY